MKVRCTNIRWDTDGEESNLPTELTVEVEEADDVTDALSDVTGFCHFGFDQQIIHDKLKLQLVFEVEYNLDGENPEAMIENLKQITQNAMNDGWVTGDSMATVESHDTKVTVRADPTEELSGLQRLRDRVKELKLTDLDLDDVVHDLATQIGSGSNNEGIDGQTLFIYQQIADSSIELVEKLAERKGDRGA